MPVCSYFLKGICSNSNCPYSHVYVSRKAEVCSDFLKGYCPLGAKVRGLQVGTGQVVKQSLLLSALTSVVLHSLKVKVTVIPSISQMTQKCSKTCGGCCGLGAGKSDPRLDCISHWRYPMQSYGSEMVKRAGTISLGN